MARRSKARKIDLKKLVKGIPFVEGEQLSAGQPCVNELKRFENNSALTMTNYHTCCGCGFRHAQLHEVFHVKGSWYLQVRYIADETTRPKGRKKR